MYLLRRTALRAASSSPSTSFVSKSRTITTSSPFLLRSKAQSVITPSVFRRYASDEANSSAEEKSSVESADSSERSSIESAISSAAETVNKSFQEARDTVADAAAGTASSMGFPPRGNTESKGFAGHHQDRRPAVNRVLVPSKGIYVGNLLFDVTSSDLEKEFEAFGPIKSAVVATDGRGLSKGFGYIEFETIDQATKAVSTKNQAVFEGRRLVVNYMSRAIRNFQPNAPSKTLFIGNLAFEMSDADLNKLFRDIRNVIDVRVAIDRRTGQPRGFAHADFVDIESAQKGFELLQGKEIYGRKLRVDYSTGNRETRGDGSGNQKQTL